MTTHEQFMQEALHEGERAFSEDLFPVGSVIVRNAEIIGRGRRGQNSRVDHAETNALRSAFATQSYQHGDGLILYTTLEPCAMCFGTVLNCPIDMVVYALEDPYGGAAGHFTKEVVPVRHQDKYPEIIHGLLRAEAKALLGAYLADPKDDFWKENQENPLALLCRE